MPAGNLEAMVERSICEDRETPILLVLSSKDGLPECEKSMLRGTPGLVAPVDTGVAGLSATAGVDERRAVTISAPEMPSREVVELHQLAHIPFAVKSIPPTTENWLRKLYTYSKKNYMSTADKHETNHINKCNDTNTDTRKMHNT